MKKIIAIALLLIITKNIFSQNSIVLYTVEESSENKKDIFAIPFVIYKKGEYIDPPICLTYSEDSKDKQECNTAKNTLFPFVKKGTLLYLFKVGKRLNKVSKIESLEFYDYICSGKLKTIPDATILINNARAGTQATKKIKTLPKIEETQFEGVFSKHILIGKIDIDGNGIAEIIYRCDAPEEAPVYKIYSFKKKSWQLVYEGGRRGG